MNKNIYMMLDGEIMETFKNVSEVSYENKTLSFYINETDYNFDEINSDIVCAPSDITITKDNYKDYLLEKEISSDDKEILKLKKAIYELTILLAEKDEEL